MCACGRALILKRASVCVCLLWMWADTEQLRVNECPQLAVIVGAGAVEPSVGRAEWFPMRAFCVALNSRDSSGCRYHTEVIEIASGNGGQSRQLAHFTPEKKPKQSVALAPDNDLSITRLQLVEHA